IDAGGHRRVDAARRQGRWNCDPRRLGPLCAGHRRCVVGDIRLRAAVAREGPRRLILSFLGEANLEGGSNPALSSLRETKGRRGLRRRPPLSCPKDELFKRVPRSSLRSRWSTPSDTPLQGDNETWITSFLKSRRPPPVTRSR